MALFLLPIALLANFPLRYIHTMLYAIARSVRCGLNITSSFFLENMNDEARFTKAPSLARWNSFIEAVDLEVSSHIHDDSVFLLSENLGRIAKMPCPPELDCTSYKACINVLLSSKKLHLRLLKSMVETHRKGAVCICSLHLQQECKGSDTELHPDGR